MQGGLSLGEGNFLPTRRERADGYYIFSGSSNLAMQRLWPLTSTYSRSMKHITAACVASENDDEKDEALKLDAPERRVSLESAVRKRA